ncbi:MAG: hypothetical protein JWM46_623 [Candidatus Kaiserbacteria bacterium]|nr:hypothetical protein [Candidatus Kaiserbacteria bacterium]
MHLHAIAVSQTYKGRLTKTIDGLIYIGGVVGPITTLPQLIEIFLHKSAQDVSLYSWTSYLLGTIGYLMYGILHKQKPIIFLNAINLPVYALIVIGILMYR